MKPDWLIQINMEGVDTEPMIAEITAQGMVVQPIEYHLGEQIDFSKYGSNNDCVVCYGDIDFVHQAKRRAPFIPGAWCNFENMKCSTYYTYLGEHLLNQEYKIMPVGELLRRWDKLVLVYSLFTEKELAFMQPTFIAEPCKSLFIRPNSGAKPFTGYIVAHDDKHKIQLLVQAVGPETLVIVAPERKITAEWRFVVCNRKIIAGCQYLPIESPNYPASSLCLAEKIATQEWQPDLCYTVDIAESEGKMRLLEINSFSCAGFYKCDIESIVRHANKAAIDEWQEYHVPA